MTTAANNPAANHPASSEPLSEQHYREMREAKVRRKKIDVAIGVATFNGWSLGIFAGLSALILPFSISLLGVLITVGLAWVAYTEFQGRTMLRQLNPDAAKKLAYNQIALAGVIVGYCLWNIIDTVAGPGAYAEVIERNPELEQMLGGTGEVIQMLTVVVYSVVIVLTIPYQALIAWYYYSRAKHIRQYVSQTPRWVTNLQKEAA